MIVQAGLIGLFRAATVRERIACESTMTPNRHQTLLAGLNTASADSVIYPIQGDDAQRA